MRKGCIAFLFILLAGVIWFAESRSFFCLQNGRCITVWKTFGDVCYIAPGKYFGVLAPSTDFIKTSNTSDITIFFYDELPNILIYQSDDIVEVKTGSGKNPVLYDFSSDTSKYFKMLYMPDAKRHKDVKQNVEFISVYIRDIYARDKRGRNL